MRSKTPPLPASSDSESSIAAAKSVLRRQMKTRLNDLVVDRDAAARAIFLNLAALPAFQAASTLAVYVDFGVEAPTRPFLPDLFGGDATPRRVVAVPFCQNDELLFYRIDKPTRDAATGRPYFFDLAPRTFGILEPTTLARADSSRAVAPTTFDLVFVPGLAFDGRGRRLGRGAGFYDRFLPLLSPRAQTIGIAFDEQIVDSVPTQENDVSVDAIVTPTRIVETHSPRRKIWTE